MSDRASKAVVATVGYSAKPLGQKLGLKPGLRVRLRHAPPEYWAWCGIDEAGVDIVRAGAFDFGHVFATTREGLERDLATLAPALDANGMLWISWPKKSSRVATDITENTLRELALPLGLVDVKVCAVSEVWSGLKFVWRRERRSNLAT
jgi:hypothetical protein